MEDRMTAQQLKNSILQMAVQGKLVPQDPNDEPASVLLDRIRKEKEQLIKDGKIKKNKKESYIFRGADNLRYEQIGKEVKCIEDELPFEIPDNWEWCKLESICSKLVDGDHNPPKGISIQTNYLMCSSTNINNDKLTNLEKVRYLTEEVFNKENERTRCKKGDILFTSVGSLGRSCIYEGNLNICFQRSVSVIATFIFNQYLKYFFDNPFFQNRVNKEATGTAQKGFYLNQLATSLIAIPPLNEQYRIVDKIKELEPLIEKYNHAEIKLYELNSNIKQQLKKSILQYAIKGKLVPQDSNDEPASVLLDRIRKEKQKLISEGKIKKCKNESIIYRRDNSYYEKLGKNEICIDELIPFDIPHNWTWTRLSSIANTFGGYAFKSTEYTNTGVRVIRISDFDNNGILDGEYKYYYEEESLNKYLLKENDILLCMTGGTVGKTCVNNRKTKQYLNQRVASIRTYDLIYYRYVYKVITSNYIQCIINKSKTSTNDNISMDTINDFLIPLPPYNEQVRICEAIDKI